MNKKEISVVVVLFLLLFGWQFIYMNFFAPPPQEKPATPAAVEGTTAAPAPAATGTSSNAVPQPAIGATPAGTPAEVPAIVASTNAVVDNTPAQLTTISNDLVTVTFSSKGASVVKGVFHNYHYTTSAETNVFFNFEDQPSLVYEGLSGFGAGDNFQSTVDPGGHAITYTRTDAAGLQLKRTYTLQTNNYVVLIKDEFFNAGAAPTALGAHKIRLGHVLKLPDTTAMMPPSGIDAFHQNEVTHYSFKLAKWVKKSEGRVFKDEINEPVEWVAVKNKYYGHLICALEGDMGTPVGFEMYASQSGDSKYPDNVAAALKLPAAKFDAGQTFSRDYTYYIGPKKVDMLKKLSNGEENIMEYGRTKIFVPICNGLLAMLNFIYPLVGNYGVAIIGNRACAKMRKFIGEHPKHEMAANLFLSVFIYALEIAPTS